MQGPKLGSLFFHGGASERPCQGRDSWECVMQISSVVRRDDEWLGAARVPLKTESDRRDAMQFGVREGSDSRKSHLSFRPKRAGQDSPSKHVVPCILSHPNNREVQPDEVSTCLVDSLFQDVRLCGEPRGMVASTGNPCGSLIRPVLARPRTKTGPGDARFSRLAQGQFLASGDCSGLDWRAVSESATGELRIG